MRDNVSIIFAAIFAVLLLIVFPLFSLLTRQDSIAYNKVLTLTTEFVDGVRTKGYFTEREYTDYLLNLTNTNNTYKVEMECHKKLLIKDVNKYTNENPVWVEDTAIYYNTYIVGELENAQVLSLDEGDEFYIKIYNTNITTASLLYNFFLGSSVPQKIINIGYGGKILNNTGNVYEKTSFNSSYTPYITFDEILNNAGKDFKQCYDEEDGTYYIQNCVRVVDIDNENNNTLNVKFKLYNFKRIGERDVNSTTFQDNESYFANMIKENTVLRGDYISSYNVEIEDLNLESGYVEGNIKISNIVVNPDTWRTTAHIVITSNLGIGSTGAVSSEGTSAELILTQKELINISGPYLNKNANEVVTTTLNNNEPAYYKVALKNSNGIAKIELFDTATSSVLATYTSFDNELVGDDYKVKVEKVAQTSGASIQEYWVRVTPLFEDDTNNMFVSRQKELQLIVYSDSNADTNLDKTKTVSKVVMWKSLMLDIKCNLVTKLESETRTAKIEFTTETDNNIISHVEAQGKTYKEFFQELVDNNVIYISKGSSNSEIDNQFKIKILTVNRNSVGTSTWSVSYTYEETYISGAPKQETIYFNLKDSTGNVKNYSFKEYINIPSGYTFELKNGVMTINKGKDVYYWLPASEENITTGGYYDSTVTEGSIKESIKKYGGVYIALNTQQVGDFYATWNWASSFDHTQLFGSLVYEWQLNRVIAEFGSSVEIGSSSSGASFWVATNVDTNKSKTALWNSSGNYTFSSYDKTKTTDTNGVNIKGLRVLYIK